MVSTPDPAAFLAEVRERAGRWASATSTRAIIESAEDVQPLLGALEAVLALHAGVVNEDYPKERPFCGICGEWSPCETYAAISAGLLGEGSDRG